MSSKNTGAAPEPDHSGQSFMHPPFLDFALKSPASVPGIWKETVSALADATDDYAVLLRQLSQAHSPLDASIVFGRYYQESTSKQLARIAGYFSFARPAE